MSIALLKGWFVSRFIGNEPAARTVRGSGPLEQRRAMKMQALKSAAHAAGYAMAAEDMPEPRPQFVRRPGTALVVRSRPASIRLLRAQRYLRRLWLREWMGVHWPGRAAA